MWPSCRFSACRVEGDNPVSPGKQQETGLSTFFCGGETGRVYTWTMARRRLREREVTPDPPEAEDPMEGARSEANPGARLLRTARRMFYEQGYPGAGINEIIELSQTSKKSFYAYYPSKQTLGEAALRAEEAELHKLMSGLMRRHQNDYVGFVRAWSRTLKRLAACGDYHGCPFANAAAQAPLEFQDTLAAVVADWKERLTDYLKTCRPELPEREAEEVAVRLLIEYQGSIQMWKLTRDVRHFDRFAELAARLPEGLHSS